MKTFRPEVVSLKSLTNTGSLRALASVRVGRVVIHDFRLVQQQGQRAFVQPPQRSWVQDGTVRYGGPLVEFPPDILEKIAAVILQRAEADGFLGRH
jgi:DNA-binding cell septation regulator SpoVG